MLEKDIEAYLVKRVKDLGGIAYKFTSPQRRSIPDRLCLLPGGFVFFVELKAPGKKPDGHQEREHERLRTLGCNVFVISTYEQVDEYVKERA